MSTALQAQGAPLISVLLPVRNGAVTIEAAVRSVLAQTWSRFELLVLDDGSDDDTAAVLARIDDPRVRVLRDGLHRGLSSRLNQGVALARGEFIARMDADDVSLPERLELQLQYLAAHPDVDLVGCRAAVFRGHQVLGLLPFAATHAQICARPWHTLPLPHPTWLGRRAWFVAHPYRDPEVVRAEDQELLLRARGSSRYACLPDVLLAYRLGTPRLGSKLRARASLLRAQIRVFAAEGAWGLLLLAVAGGLAKAGRDVAARVSGADGFRITPVDALLAARMARALNAAAP